MPVPKQSQRDGRTDCRPRKSAEPTPRGPAVLCVGCLWTSQNDYGILDRLIVIHRLAYIVFRNADAGRFCRHYYVEVSACDDVRIIACVIEAVTTRFDGD